MNKTSHQRIWAAIVSFATIATVSVSGVAFAQGSSAPAPRECAVTVDTSATTSTYQVVRQEFKSGRCICAVTTTAVQDASIQGRIAALLKSKTCEDATSVAMTGQGPGIQGTAVGMGLGFLGSAVIVAGLYKLEDRPVSP